VSCLHHVQRAPRGKSPWIANLLGCHTTPSSTIAILELCRGGSLQRHLQKLKKRRGEAGGAAVLADAEVATFGTQIAQALTHLHAHDVTHRDLKPANILFYGERHLKLCDFGFARYQRPAADDANVEGESAEGDRCHTICGTPIYMAPELTRSNAYCAKGYDGKPVDVWAYGTVLYEMSHNQVAFAANSGEQLYQRIRGCQHSPLRPSLPHKLKDLIKSCLTVQPSKRPTAEALLAEPPLAGETPELEC